MDIIVIDTRLMLSKVYGEPGVLSYICNQVFSYMSKTDHEYDIVTISTKFNRYRYQHADDIVDIVTNLSISIPSHCDDIVDITISTYILTISNRYRQGFINIDTSKLWRYRPYRHDIDKVTSISIPAHWHIDVIVDIVMTRFRRYRYYPDVDEVQF